MIEILRSLQIPEGLATAIFGAALVLLLIAMFGNKEISIKEINIGRVGTAGRVLACALGLVFLMLSLVSFVSFPVEDEANEELANVDANRTNVSALPAPATRRSICGTTIEWPARERFIILYWESVEGASTYTVEADCFGCFSVRRWASQAGEPWHFRDGLGLRSPIYSSQIHHMLYDQQGQAVRWRVWAVDQNGNLGDKSDWCQISFFGVKPD